MSNINYSGGGLVETLNVQSVIENDTNDYYVKWSQINVFGDS